MKNLLRAAAVCALTLTAISTVNAATLGTCRFRCYPGFTIYTTMTTQAECCGGDFAQYCSSGEGYALSWNGYRCIA
jgi:hypothetical protein